MSNVKVMPNDACPVCGGKLCPSGSEYALGDIFALWQPIVFSDGIVAEHAAQAQATRRYCCEGCRLEIFLPQIIGTPGFYVEAYNLTGLQQNSGFTYSETKWDFDEARGDARGCRCLAEIGCGPGYFLDSVRGIVPDVCGVEYNEPAARQARARGLNVVREFREIPQAGHLDAVFCFHVLEHVGDPVGFVSALVELVRPGGRIGLSVPNQGGPMRFLDPCAMNMPPHHATRWQFSSLSALANRLGVRVERVAYEPLLLENHSYYSVSWVKHAFPGSGPWRAAWRWLLSAGLRAGFRLLRGLGLQYLRGLRGQSIYVLLARPAAV